MKRLFKGWFEFDPFYVNMNEHFNEQRKDNAIQQTDEERKRHSEKTDEKRI